MKYVITFMLLLILCKHTFAQTNFMPVGATVSGKGFARGFIGNVVFTSEKDTLCNGAPCRKVNVAYNNTRFPNRSYSEIQFFQQRGDSVFGYDAGRRELGFRFKNNYAVGDSMVLDPRPEYYSVMYIDSAIISNGIKRFAARKKCVEISNLGTLTLISRINLYDKFFPDRHPYALTCYENDLVFYTPLCYTDNVTNYQSIYYTGRCDSIQTITATTEISDNLVLSPNPATIFVNIESPQAQFISVKMYTMNGILIRQKTALSPTTMDVQDLPNGLYILFIQRGKSVPTMRKLIVNH